MTEETRPTQLDVRDIDIELLQANSWNPNEMDDSAFNRLLDELKSVGMIDPIQVVPLDDGTFRIIGGEHRAVAGKALGWTTLPCVVLSEEKWRDEDLQKLVTVRLNVLKGKMNPEKMVGLYNEMAAKYGAGELQKLFAYTDQGAWEKLVKTISGGLRKSGLPKGAINQFNKQAKELKTVDDLSMIIQQLFTKYGDTLQYSFMVFTFGGKEHLYVAMDRKMKKAMDRVIRFCREWSKDMNEVLAKIAVEWVKKADEEEQAAMTATSGGEVGNEPASGSEDGSTPF